jgi:ABC-2 type transport system permease protein
LLFFLSFPQETCFTRPAMPNELSPNAHRWTATQTRAQFAAIAWLRWRILVNGLRRKGGAGELVGRIVLGSIFGSFAVLFVAASGVAAYLIAARGQLAHVSWILWAIFVLCQLLNIQLGQPGTTFDPTQLIRFPLSAQTYTAIRLFFGLLTPANIAGTLMSCSVAVGVMVALPQLWLATLLALVVFAVANVLFSRMVFAWVDRWLSTRRAREVFTGLVFVFSLGIQWANFTFNPAYNHHGAHSTAFQRLRWIPDVYARAHPLLKDLPPELTSAALVAAQRSQPGAFALYTLGCTAFAALFLAIFALRMRTEFRGESLSDAANAVARPTAKPSASSSRTTAALAPASTHTLARTPAIVSPVMLAVLTKELLFLRRHMGILYGLIMPVFLVLILAGREHPVGVRLRGHPAAVGYTLLTVGPLSYNSLGLEGAGSQLYFLIPVRMRDIFLAKNLFHLGMVLVELIAVFGIVCYVATPPTFPIALAALLWAIGTLALNTIFGNRRSITAPKKANLQRIGNRQTSQLSAFLSLGILVASAALAAGLFLLTTWLKLQWLLVPLLAVFAAVSLMVYVKSLDTLDGFAQAHREELFAELCKPD